MINVGFFGGAITGQRQVNGTFDGWSYFFNQNAPQKCISSSFAATSYGGTFTERFTRLVSLIPLISSSIDCISFSAYEYTDGLGSDLYAQKQSILSAQKAIESAGLGFLVHIISPCGKSGRSVDYMNDFLSLDTWLKGVYPSNYLHSWEAISVGTTTEIQTPLYGDDNLTIPNAVGSALLGNTLYAQTLVVLENMGYTP